MNGGKDRIDAADAAFATAEEELGLHASRHYSEHQ